jgi:DNA-binding NarL/FixJ family response regulator
VDDHEGVCLALKGLVERRGGWSVCGYAVSSSEALRLFESARPDLAVVDLRIGCDDGTELLRDLRLRSPEIRLIVYTLLDERENMERCVAAGADGFVSKRRPPAALLEAIDAVSAGARFFAPAEDREERSRDESFL